MVIQGYSLEENPIKEYYELESQKLKELSMDWLKGKAETFVIISVFEDILFEVFVRFSVIVSIFCRSCLNYIRDSDLRLCHVFIAYVSMLLTLAKTTALIYNSIKQAGFVPTKHLANPACATQSFTERSEEFRPWNYITLIFIRYFKSLRQRYLIASRKTSPLNNWLVLKTSCKSLKLRSSLKFSSRNHTELIHKFIYSEVYYET